MSRKNRFLYLEVLAALLPLASWSVELDSYHLRDMCYAVANDSNNIGKVHRPRHAETTTGPCASWKKTCCSNEDSAEIASGERVKFDLCGKKMSDKCRGHFERKLCFQDCSPYIAPWMLNRTQPRRNTEFKFVPLCREECEIWWNDCKDDWAEYESWPPNGDNTYIDGKCETIASKYEDSTYFCEHAFGPFEFLVVSDSQMCMTLFGSHFNNKYVAMSYADDSGLLGRTHLNYSIPKPTVNTGTSGTTPQTKFLILCFFLGGIVTTIGFVLGCFLLAKCRPGVKRTTSQISLIAEEPIDDQTAKDLVVPS